MNFVKTSSIVSLALACFLPISSMAEEMMRSPADPLWKSKQCGGKSVDLMVNHRTVATPSLVFADKNGRAKIISIGQDSCYAGLKCVSYKGSPHIVYVEIPACGGNAVPETYVFVDVNTYKKTSMNYMQASRFGGAD